MCIRDRGKALEDGYRKKVFLMTKIDGRSKKEATRQLDDCLKRLKVDMIDLVQHHEIIRFEDPHRIFDKEGANAALVEALSLIHISEPTRLLSISYAVFC